MRLTPRRGRKTFFGTPDALTNIPLAKAESITDDNHFRFVLPDFASDRVNGAGISLPLGERENDGQAGGAAGS